jgi:hypothetical protein
MASLLLVAAGVSGFAPTLPSGSARVPLAATRTAGIQMPIGVPKVRACDCRPFL